MTSMSGLLALANQQGIVYHSLPECRISVGLFQNIVQGQTSPVEVTQSVRALIVKHPCIPDATHLYYSDIPGYNLLLYSTDIAWLIKKAVKSGGISNCAISTIRTVLACRCWLIFISSAMKKMKSLDGLPVERMSQGFDGLLIPLNGRKVT